MLVLSRKKNETLLIEKEIEIIILDIDGDRVKIGIKAPSATKILRGELVRETESLNRESAGISLADLKNILGKIQIK